MPPKPTTPESAARVQSSQAKNGGDMTSGGFAARLQSAGAKNANAQGQSGQTGSGATPERK
ncbi:hypothetical protein E4U58_001531 [Claviceps cyperi]|nr:hypothetical protein E4U58_001531 [Claviceps cyperi]